MKRICPGWFEGSSRNHPKFMGQKAPYEDKHSITTTMFEECVAAMNGESARVKKRDSSCQQEDI